MKRMFGVHSLQAGACAALIAAGFLLAPTASSAAQRFGLVRSSVDGAALDQAGHSFTQAGGHPASVVTEFELHAEPNPKHGGIFGEGFGLPISAESDLRNVTVEAPPGLIGNPAVIPKCTLQQFSGLEESLERTKGNFELETQCPDSTQVGIVYTTITLGANYGTLESPLYNLVPQIGQPALFGFRVGTTPIFAVPSIRYNSDYGINFNVINIDQTAAVTANRFIFWGVPADSSHDSERGEPEFSRCGGPHTSKPPCPAAVARRAFLTNPTDCAHGPFEIPLHVEAWEGQQSSVTITTHDDEGNAIGVTRCDRVPFEPSIGALPSTKNAQSPSGLTFDLSFPEDGLVNPDGIAQSALKKASVTLPEGFTLNPSAGEGLGYCSEAAFAREQVLTPPGAGCPNSSKLATVQIESPLLASGELAEGALYVAQPNDPTRPGPENPFDSLIAVYLVARVPDRGVVVKSSGRVDLDPQTGQITTTFDELPQLPFSNLKLHFREGGRAPLVTPSSCGEKTTVANLYPYSDQSQVTEATSVSSITNGADGGSCPVRGLPPFKPDLVAGSINNAAGRFSPFYTRLTRTDSEQEITHFSIKLPPGLVGRLAGIPFCSDRRIARAISRERIGGGQEELLSPSCPAASQVGRTLVGAGVGSTLTYVPGKVYLAGSYHGSPISIVAITAGVVGPFDIGTVTVREALRVNPETGEVFIDATGSDPIPHIVDGVATHIRDLRVYVDRPEFTLNPTSCEPTSTSSTVLGSGLDFTREADDNPFVSTSPFQAADCAALPFSPKLTLRLVGPTKRGGDPALHAHLAMHGFGEAGVAFAQVALPNSEFLDNAHINGPCTRVQFKEGAVEGEKCPRTSIIGHAKAVTPILSEPLEGPVYLRSNPEHNLPDIAAALRGSEISVVLAGRVDSTKGGGLRNTFEVVPDAPVSSFDLDLFGGNRGLLENAPKGTATSICGAGLKATVKFTGHNGKQRNLKDPIKATGCAQRAKHPKRHRGR